MKQHYDVIIVGGGVIGCSVAFQLCKRDYRVLVVEKDSLAGKASGAAAGMLGAQAESEKNNPLFPIAKESRAMFLGLAEELRSLTGIDIELIQSGILKIARTNEEAAEFKDIAAFQQKLHKADDHQVKVSKSTNRVAQWLTPEKILQQEQVLSENLSGGLWLPEDGQVNPPLLTKAYAQAAAVLGAKVMEYTAVQGLVIEYNCVVGVKTGTETIFADEVIVAAGAWSEQLLNNTGLKLDSYPVKGECFSVRHHGQLITSSIFSTSCYIVPKVGGRIIIGATQKPHTFDETVSLNSLLRLMEDAVSIIPALKETKWEKAWAGVRPQTGDGLPYLGRHPRLGGLSLAAGHYRNGILLAPITGLLMADLMDGSEIDSVFRTDRMLTQKEGST
ncbi:glycine oxidase ThiO [Virgibacillus siamensis]|uniref:glycine oxidase ThiO n=1 Tax=Virgibacillus siamensis TaxID=480071 RepID=UPI000987A7A4|nr:glycine oxidase ThiO [Virgibacillus siamensis]